VAVDILLLFIYPFLYILFYKGALHSLEIAPLQKVTKISIFLHHGIILFGLFLLFQDLLAENLKQIGILFRVVKYIDEGGSLFLFLLLVTNHLYKKLSVKRNNIDIPLLLFFFIGLLSSVAKRVPNTVYISQFIIDLKPFLFFYAFSYLPIHKRFLEQYLRFFFWVGFIIFLFGLIDLAAPYQFRALTGNNTFVEVKYGIPSVKSFFYHPAVFGWFMNFLSLYCFALFIVKKKNMFLVLGIMFFLGCLLSMRLKSIMGFIISLWLGVLIYPVKKGKSVVTAFLSILMIFILIFAGSMISQLFQSKYTMYVSSETSSDAARNVLYLKSIEVARDAFPFGVGFGRYGSWTSRVHFSPVYYQYGLNLIWGMSEDFPNFIADTFWPMIIGETGFIGFGFYLVVFIIMLRYLYRNVKKRKDPLLHVYFLGTFMIFLESITESIASPVFISPPYAFFIFGAIGIAFALQRIPDEPEFKRERDSTLVKKDR
jgi:hypothetical protein